MYGARGFVGRNLVAELERLGHDVIAPPRGSFVVGSDGDNQVIYAIGLTSNFRGRTRETIAAHVSVLQQALDTPSISSFTYLSSTRVYLDCSSSNPHYPVLVNPNDHESIYSLSKLLGEAMVLEQCGTRGRVVRLSSVVGPGSSPSFVSSLIQDARSGSILLQTSLGSEKDYVSIDDVVGVLPSIALHGSKRIYNVASGQQVTNGQLVAALQAATGCRVDVVPEAPTLRFPRIEILETQREFAFSPRPLLSSLQSLINSEGVRSG